MCACVCVCTLTECLKRIKKENQQEKKIMLLKKF